MENPEVNCTACGASFTLANRFVKLVICEYCGTTSSVGADGLDPKGKTSKLPDFPSLFFLGAKGTVMSKRFLAQGRLRFDYNSGFWDEWYLVFEDGDAGWMHEDEGEYTLFIKEEPKGNIPAFENITVGMKYDINRYDVFIVEKRTCVIVGGEGQLEKLTMPGETIPFVDGNCKGKIISIEYLQDGPEICFGGIVLPKAIKIENSKT
ncbi:DUF4178 domain-containing protein [Candidatus Riflebacteria bacterium]